MSQTSSNAQAMKHEDLFCASSIYGSRGRAKESERKLSKPCYEQDFSWSLRFQFIYGRGESIRRDKRCFSIDFYFFRSRFAEGVIAKYFHLTVFFRLAFSKRLFRLAFRRKHTHDAWSANKHFWHFFFGDCICRSVKKWRARSAKRYKLFFSALLFWGLRLSENEECAGSKREARKIFCVLLFLWFAFAGESRRRKHTREAQNKI